MGLAQTIVNGTAGTVGNVLGSVLKSAESSAMAAELQATREANAFNAAEAALNRQFQQSSAERSMAVSSEEARLAREFSAFEAEKQRAWEKEMSDTAYQRAVKDLQAAGLNPQLLYTNLNAASTPSGSSAQSFSGYGTSASGSSASGYKADVASAKKSDLSILSQLVPLIVLSVASSALDTFKSNEVVQKLKSFDNFYRPKVSYIDENGNKQSFRWLGYQSTDAKKMFRAMYEKKKEDWSKDWRRYLF